MTKEDYMKLSKERLAELLEERDKQIPIIPTTIIHESPRPLCWEEGGTCTNPFHDCINCPKTGSSGSWATSNLWTTKGE